MEFIKKFCKKLGIYKLLVFCADYYTLLLSYVSNIFCLLPINNNKIVVDNFHGEGFGQNPRYIVEAIHNMDSSIEIVWVVKKDVSIPVNYVRTVRYRSFRSYYEFATARIWIDDVRDVIKTHKRDNQYYLQTWHGTYGPKLSEGDALKSLNPKYIRLAKIDGKNTDGIIVHSLLQEEAFKRAYWLNPKTEYLRYGLPRNDEFIRKSKKFTKDDSVFKAFNIHNNDFIILYAPTFRDNGSDTALIKNFDDIIAAFKSRFPDQRFKVLIRLHPNSRQYKNDYIYNEYIIDATDFYDFQPLVDISDCLITDYSTTSVDFGICNKPVFLYTNDIDEMIQNGRIDSQLFDFPFCISKTIDELVKHICNFNKEDYLERVRKYFSKHPIYDNGDASYKTAMWIIDKMKLNRNGDL